MPVNIDKLEPQLVTPGDYSRISNLLAPTNYNNEPPELDSDDPLDHPSKKKATLGPHAPTPQDNRPDTEQTVPYEPSDAAMDAEAEDRDKSCTSESHY